MLDLTMMLSLAVSAGICALLLWVLKGLASAVRTHLTMMKIPAPPAANALLGHVGVLDSSHAPFLVHGIAKKLGPVFRLRVAHMHLLVITDPADVMRVCGRGDHYLDKAPYFYHAFNKPHAENNPKLCNILTSRTNDMWRAIRRATAPCFTSSQIKAALPLLIKFANDLAQQLEVVGPNHVVELNDISKRYTLDAIATWGFDQPVHACDDLTKPSELVVMVNDLIKAVHMVAVDPLWQLKSNTPMVKAGLRAFKLFDVWTAEYSQRLKARTGKLPAHCIGATLLAIDDPGTGGKLTDDMLKTNTGIFLAAGYETTASTMTTAILLLAKYPEWMERVEAELDAAGLLKTPARRETRELTHSDLSQLPVLNAVIKETLRFMPAAALGTFRQTTKDEQIGGYTVPAGVSVIFSTYAVNHSTLAFGPDADEFKPDRWLANEQGKQISAPPQGGQLREHLAFSYGPRDCIGQALAVMELQTFLCMLLSRFKVRLAPSMGAPQEAWASIVYHITFSMASGLWVTLEAR